MRAYLAATLRIWLFSPLLRVPAAAAVFMLASCGLQFTTGNHDWADARGFLNLWVVAAGPVFVAVLSGYFSHLDRRDRAGGTELRHLPSHHRLLGRSLITFLFMTLLHVVAIGVWFTLSAVTVDDPRGTATQLASALLITVSLSGSYIWYCVVLSMVTAYSPVVGTAIVGLVTVVLGILTSESSNWFLLPPAWMLRSVLGLIGTHANGTTLVGAALPAGPIPIIGSTALGGLALVASSRSGGRGVVAPVIRGWTVPILAVAAVGVTALALRWRSVSDAVEVFGLLILPIGCTVLSVLWVARLRGASRALACRPVLPEAIGLRLLIAMHLVVASVVVAVGGVAFAAGYPAHAALTHSVVFACAGAALVGISTLVAVTFGTFPAVAFGVIGTIFGALVGGTDAYPSVRSLLPFAWAADTALLPLVPVASALAVITSVFAARRVYAVRRR